MSQPTSGARLMRGTPGLHLVQKEIRGKVTEEVGYGRFWLKRVMFLSESEVSKQQAAAGSKPPASP